jgi:L-cysteine/cystine lyase
MREVDDLCSGPAYLEGVGLFARQAEANSRAREAAARSWAPARRRGPHPEHHPRHEPRRCGIDWREGDEVISATTEHPGCLAPLHNLRRRFGVEVNLVSPPVTPEKIEAASRREPPRRALPRGLDERGGAAAEEICTLARGRDVLTLIDGAQSVGNIAVDVPASGADMYAFTGHKWVLGPEGLGAFYVRPGLPVHSPNVGFRSLLPLPTSTPPATTT